MKLLEEYLKKLNIPYDNTIIDKFLKYYELLIHFMTIIFYKNLKNIMNFLFFIIINLI